MSHGNIEKLTLLLLENAYSYHKYIFEEIKPFLRGKILEIGCGIGNLTFWLIQHLPVLAIDMNEDYLELIQKKFAKHPNLINTLLWDIRREPPKEIYNQFDTIVCSNVLEHIENDESVLMRFYNLLSNRGRVIIFVPALKILYNQLDLELGHMRRYGKKDLFYKLNKCGFKIYQIKYFNIFGILGWFINGKLLKRKILPKDQLYIFDRLFPFLIKVEKIFPNTLGQSLIAIGEK